MKRWICLLLCLALPALSACGSPILQESPETAAPAPAASETAAPAAEAADDLTPVLLEISGRMHPGTAGSSLTALDLACRLLDCCMETEMGEEQIRAAVEELRTGMDERAQKDFALQLLSVSSACERLLGADGEQLLEDIGGAEGTRWPWTGAATDKLETVFASARMTELTADAMQ